MTCLNLTAVNVPDLLFYLSLVKLQGGFRAVN
jgi:hypothetical protein